MAPITRQFISLICILSCTTLAIADEDFVIKRIELAGLQNMLPTTMYRYLPLKVGELFSSAQSRAVINTLYQTGFFDQVVLAHRGNTLIVTVDERPTITQVKIDGNSEIDSDKIEPVLKKIGITAGNVYDPLKIKLFEQSLEQQYAIMGYAATRVRVKTKPYPHNRVAVTIHVDEGKVVKVHAIHFVGNHAFSAHTLKKQFDLTTSGLWTFISHTDRYSELKLQRDLENLSHFYLNHGYIQFRILDQKVVYSEDRKHVDLTITIEEGAVYRIESVQVNAEDAEYSALLNKQVTIKPNDVFSRQKILEIQMAMKKVLADKAYAFATIKVDPKIDPVRHRVVLIFDVLQGKRVYVRRISFSGNSQTDQTVLRHEMRQMEAAPYSLSAIENSKRHLSLLPYFPRVDISTTPVTETNNQVDLNYVVEEKSAGKASVQGGYSSGSGFLYGASISQPNFLGSGKYVSIGFNNSESTQNYYFNYTNPYYTWYHVSRGFLIYYNLNHYDENLNYTPYTMDTYGTTVQYGLPLSENNSLGLDLGYSNVHVFNVNQANVAPSVSDFMDPSGLDTAQYLDNSYDVTKVVGTWTYNGLDRYTMPSSGVRNQIACNVGVPFFTNNLSYVSLTDSFSAFVPLAPRIIPGLLLNFIGNFGYGQSYDSSNNDLFPFMYNFYAGGIEKVSGYKQNSLGPKYGSNTAYPGSALGGNLMTTAGVHLVLPNLFNNSLRLALTLEAGNVFQSPVYEKDVNQMSPSSSTSNLVIQDDTFALKNMRTSAGILVVWNAPMFGPIDLSLAFPLNEKEGDKLEPFQFAMGISF